MRWVRPSKADSFGRCVIIVAIVIITAIISLQLKSILNAEGGNIEVTLSLN